MRTLVLEAAFVLSLLMGVVPMAPRKPMPAVGTGSPEAAVEEDAQADSWDEGDDDACCDQGSQDADAGGNEEGRVSDGVREVALSLTCDACGGVFEGGSPSLSCELPHGLPALGERLWQETCSWEGHELCGWWTDPADGVMVADADGLVAVSSLDEILAPDDARELTLFARWDIPSVTRRIGICRQRPDGSYGEPDEFVEVDTAVGEDVTWSCEETDTFCAVTRTWAEPSGEELVVEVPRRAWKLTLVADGVEEVCDEVLVGAEVDLKALSARLGIEGDVAAWRQLTPRGEVRLDVGDTVSDLVGAGDECVLEAVCEQGGVTVAFLPGCESGEVWGEMDDQVVAVDEGAIVLPECAYVRPGFSFAGWACDVAAVGGETLDAGEELDVAACGEGLVELVAVWEPRQVRVSVPVAATLEEEGVEDASVRRSTLILTNDSDDAVELVGVEVTTADAWRLVEWGAVVEDTDVALALETADGARYDLSQEDLSSGEIAPDGASGAGVRIGKGPATMRVTVLCETGPGEAEGELCSLRWVFRAVGAGTSGDANDGVGR